MGLAVADPFCKCKICQLFASHLTWADFLRLFFVPNGTGGGIKFVNAYVFPLKIISGGQTGVDRAALDVALHYGIACAGWCPEGRMAEDGVIPKRYPLTELVGADYLTRTRCNVRDSDVTILIYCQRLFGGTEQTLAFCLQQKKPYLLLDAAGFSVEYSAQRMHGFVVEHQASVVNLAGPRASEQPQLYDYTFRTLTLLMQRLTDRPPGGERSGQSTV